MIRSICVGFAGGALATLAFAQSSLPVDPGEAVSACFSSNLCGAGGSSNPQPDLPVLVLHDLRNPAGNGAVFGTNWAAPAFHNEPLLTNPHSWTARHMGQVFGVALDDQSSPNIYATSSRAYGDWPDNTLGMWGPGGPGGVYKVDGITGNICVLTSLPQPAPVPGTATGTGLGSLCFARVPGGASFLYVTNPDDGLIYRVPTAACPLPAGTVLQTFDHGVTARGAAGLATLADDPAQRFTPDARRQLWGIAYHEGENRVYYATMNKEVWSIGLDSAGNMNGTSTLEFTQAGGGNIAGITISRAGNLYTAGRTGGFIGNLHACINGPAHASSLREYRGAHLGWAPEPATKYEVGNLGGSHQNCAGGAAVDCDENVWVMGDALQFGPQFIYGLQRIPAGGNAGVDTTTSYLVDLDGLLTILDKTELGQVAIRDTCCAEIIDKRILCETAPNPDGYPATGSFFYTFCFKNNSGRPIQYLFPRELPGGDFHPIPTFPESPIALPVAVPDGATSAPITIKINNQTPGSRFCFRITFADPNIDDCCLIEHCIDLPECDCLQFPVCEAVCGPVPGSFILTLVAQNLGSMPVNEFFAIPMPPGTAGFTITQNGFVVIPSTGIPPGGFWPQMTFSINGAVPGSTVCIRFSMHLDGLECCSEVKCIRLPVCDGEPCPDCPNPTILVQPLPVEACSGDDATFIAVAEVDPACGTMSCVWRRNGAILADGPTGHGSVISGATTQQMTIAGAGLQDEGEYDNVVTAPCGTVTSEAALLTVIVIPGDADLDGRIDFADITEVLEQWGSDGAADTNGDGVVNFQDITEVLTHFGDAC